MNNDFDEIRCYNDAEAVDALGRMMKCDEFYPLFKPVFPDKNESEIKEIFLSLTGSLDFQQKVMNEAVKTVIARTMDGFSCDGIDNLSENEAYMFVANHRDIVMDAALLQHVLVSHKMNTTQITFGDNLMSSPFIIDFGKVNKMFTVIRNSDRREQVRKSMDLSAYMRKTIIDDNESVWIAQRPGRTKNGLDATQQGLLRMFSMSGKGSVKERMQELNIVPLAISYEFEPCDYLKVYENISSHNSKYVKQGGEDFTSVLEGLKAYKGRVKLVTGKPLGDFVSRIDDNIPKKELFAIIANEIDRQIYVNYKLWPNNYIAYDLLNKSKLYEEKYSAQEKNKFISHMNSRTKLVSIDEDEFKIGFLELYANPITNCIS